LLWSSQHLNSFACSFAISSHHTNFLGFRNPSAILVGIVGTESTHGNGPSEFVEDKEHTDFRKSRKAK